MRKDALASRAALLDAAWTVFGQQGPDVALTSVAEAAGVGIGTLYRHFPSRADLVAGLAGEVMRRVGDLTEEHRARWSADPAGTWRSFVTSVAELQVSALVIPVAVREMLGELPREVLDRRRELLARMDELLAEARAEGLLREGVDALRFTISLAAVTRPMPPMALRKLPDEPEFLVELFLRGLRPDPA